MRYRDTSDCTISYTMGLRQLSAYCKKWRGWALVLNHCALHPLLLLTTLSFDVKGPCFFAKHSVLWEPLGIPHLFGGAFVLPYWHCQMGSSWQQQDLMHGINTEMKCEVFGERSGARAPSLAKSGPDTNIVQLRDVRGSELCRLS